MQYLKQSKEDLELIFKPFTESEYVSTNLESKFSEIPVFPDGLIYKYAFYNFAYFDEFDFNYDACSMDEYLDVEDKKLEPLDIEVDYENLEKKLDTGTFRNFLIDYVKVLKSNFLLNFDSVLVKSENNISANAFFRRQLLSLSNSFQSLKDLIDSGQLNKFQTIVAELHNKSYVETFVYIKENYSDVFPNLIKVYGLGSQKTTNNKDIAKYIISEHFSKFLKYEIELQKRGYLNETFDSWEKEELKTLVLFYIYCKEKKIVRNHFADEKDNTFLKALELKYNLNVGDQRKPSKHKSKHYSINFARAEFHFLETV